MEEAESQLLQMQIDEQHDVLSSINKHDEIDQIISRVAYCNPKMMEPPKDYCPPPCYREASLAHDFQTRFPGVPLPEWLWLRLEEQPLAKTCDAEMIASWCDIDKKLLTEHHIQTLMPEACFMRVHLFIMELIRGSVNWIDTELRWHIRIGERSTVPFEQFEHHPSFLIVL